MRAYKWQEQENSHLTKKPVLKLTPASLLIIWDCETKSLSII